jgi:hypothetical protein
VTLGHLGGGGPSVRSVLAGIGDTHFTWLGALALNPRPVNFTDKPGAVFTTLVQQLKDQGNISSLSWGYTAGSQYRKSAFLFPCIICLEETLVQHAGDLASLPYYTALIVPQNLFQFSAPSLSVATTSLASRFHRRRTPI